MRWICREMACFYRLQQSSAPGQHVLPGSFEVTRIPRVGYVARPAGKLHQQVHLAIEIATTDAVHIPQVGPIHSNQEIVLTVVFVLQLAGCFAGTIDSMLGQFAPGRRVNLSLIHI